jgi:hypothetical protein
VHWTYAEAAKGSDLDQGDILAPTQGLKDILEKVHPHFCDDKYLGFIVATQSCDLVRRKGGAKARYISVASIRSLKEVLPRLLAQVATSIGPGMFPTSARADARRFLERLFDQNEQALGLFYLHPDTEIGLGESSVAFLRVKVALHEQHYDALVNARRGRLAPEFRGKLGWLLGNLYSRAASTDWADIDGGEKKVRALIDAYLEEQIAGAGPTWIEDELIEAGRTAGIKLDAGDHATIVAALQAHRPKPKIEQVADIAVNEVSRLIQPNAHQLQASRDRMKSVADGAIAELTALTEEHLQQVRAAVERVLEAAAKEAAGPDSTNLVRVLRNKLNNNASLRKLTK